MQDLADWLDKLGMSEYAQRFAENGISVAALPHLTDHDLKDIGVLLGHRRVMLAAISKLAGAAPATPEPTALAEPKPQDTAARRQVTVMFSDLVGSTALSARMDPEDLREVISAYQKCVAETVSRFGGFVAKYMGDGVLVYFGYPQAHEDDAERAVRAGLELIQAVGSLKSSAPLQTRVGIATGLVVVGDLIGSGAAQEQAIYFCSPQHTDSARYPVMGQMERAAGFVHDDTAKTKLDKLDAVLAQTSTRMEDATVFAEMLSLPNDGRYPALDLTPEHRRQRTLEALVSQMEALIRQNPLVMIFEDPHWTDPTSLEVFGRVIDRVRSLRALLIVTFRPDFDPPWVGRAYVTFLAVNRLGEREILAMIEGVIGNKPLPANIRQDIVERTDGISLFVEEMTKAVLDAESQGAVEHLAAAVPSSALAAPASLQASPMARLDRIGPAKDVAQIGAAIGRDFSHSLLAAVVRKPETHINSALDRLISAGLLSQQGVPPHASYLFKHALVQDAAYGTLLREPRRRFTLVSPKPLKPNSPRSPRASRSYSRAIALRLGWSQRPRAYGPEPGCGR
jgi:class 3 adenylate cyclase